MRHTSIAERHRLLEDVVTIVRRAGEAVMSVYATDFDVHGKSDDSPVTEADRRAEAIITAALLGLMPEVPVIAEEAVSAGLQTVVAPDQPFWLVDPVDGTREFVGRNGEFTVNVALIEFGQPVLGVVQAPALGLLYAGGPGVGAWCEADSSGHLPMRRPLQCRRAPLPGLTVLASRSHGDTARLQAYLDGLDAPVVQLKVAGSSLKFCQVAAGEADVYPRLGRTMEWDTAAGQAVLTGAGGSVITLGGEPLRYGKAHWENPGFVAWGLP
ncbi:3'(2'),5'-bisphosphate nucleotidase CysQ [Hydrogenophaga sp.]|uniref:3'(2'),5'-bisphosphate nucleotidase CysQ n=1 Tax=Hydrogenophaga sp. TaxID=1904254 RepID=UPI0027257522|nr:3'(2'),5'-bisphosphate nucleotidase CysQ [Hydrogenophaga sp.]MDO8903128.1 3'(2'),5'-bisphosphate nucleotidase CysQ [Hydrogenophaga sp.]